MRRSTSFIIGLGIKQHRAYRSSHATIEYRWHPLHGQKLALLRRVKVGGVDVVHVDAPSGCSREVPCWMTDAVTCSAMSVGPPAVDVDHLLELRRFLSTALGRGTTAAAAAPLAAEERDTNEEAS